MGIITNGFLIGSKKSAGGINFLRVKGQQIFRNKPQVSANYVPSPAQVLQRSLQSELTRSIRNSEVLRDLIASGWGRHVAKRTNANEFQREALRLFTREADSTLSLISQKESRMETAAGVGYDQYIIQQMASGMMPLTRSKFEFPFEAVSNENGVISRVAEGEDAVKQTLGFKFSQDYVNNVPFQLVVLTAPGAIEKLEMPFTPAEASAVVLVCVAAPAVRNGEVVGWMYSTAVTLDFNIVDDGTPRLSALRYNGTDITTGPAQLVHEDELLQIQGYNLDASQMTLKLQATTNWFPLSDVTTIVQSTETLVEVSIDASIEAEMLEGIRVGATQIWTATT